MFRRTCLLAIVAILVFWAVGRAQRGQQHPILDKIANKVIQKYEHSSCEQLLQQKSEPKSPEEEKAVELLRNNSQVRTEFLNKVAAPIANKMFECRLIP